LDQHKQRVVVGLLLRESPDYRCCEYNTAALPEALRIDMDDGSMGMIDEVFRQKARSDKFQVHPISPGPASHSDNLGSQEVHGG